MRAALLLVAFVAPLPATGIGLTGQTNCLSGRWCMGDTGLDCNEVCWKHGMYCTVDTTLFTLQWPTTNSDVDAIAADTGEVCNDYPTTSTDASPCIFNFMATAGQNKCENLRVNTDTCFRCTGAQSARNRLCPCTTSPANDACNTNAPARVPTMPPHPAPTTAGSPPTEAPTASPSLPPSTSPLVPTVSPTLPPSVSPISPTTRPSTPPSVAPSTSSLDPTTSPSVSPSASPILPTVSPSTPPSASPLLPSKSPLGPTTSPSVSPSASPILPTVSPSTPPSASPLLPSKSPLGPTTSPSVSPSASPI
eukprot:Hpha_TRINITY_DN16687_c1_g1::TRINITY_DN16687_c1_g1_i1::g.182665::m.182665